MIKNSKLKIKNSPAFTLVELMIVIMIIAILATIAIMSFQSQIFKGNDAKRKTDINRIKVAAEEYEKDFNCYPPAGIVVCTSGGTGLQPYLNEIPCDPITGQSYAYEPSCSTANCCPSWYRVYAQLQYTKDSQITFGIGPSGLYNYYSGSANAPVIAAGSSPTTPPGGGGSTTQYYGCFSGVCTPIGWNPNRHGGAGPVCDPNYTDIKCYDNCPSGNECITVQ